MLIDAAFLVVHERIDEPPVPIVAGDAVSVQSDGGGVQPPVYVMALVQLLVVHDALPTV